jgi:hypothetical protein
MGVRIYKPAKTAMQSGRAGTRRWVLEFEPSAPKEIDALMGWTGSPDTRHQVRLSFATCEEAIAYAERRGLPYRVGLPRERTPKLRSYAENFSFRRAN